MAGAELTRKLIATERKFIHILLRDGKITDETRRRIERDLDLEEASLSNREYWKIGVQQPPLPATNAKRLRKGAIATVDPAD
jgi:hypothetical protein